MDQIDLEPLEPGWGCVWQSGLDEWWQGRKVHLPKITVSMIGPVDPSVMSLSVFMDDTDTAILPDNELLAMSDAALSFLKCGTDIIVHCFEGKYRSTYMDVAIHMRAGMLFEDAYALVRSRHTIALLRNGTMVQLKRMEAVLNDR